MAFKNAILRRISKKHRARRNSPSLSASAKAPSAANVQHRVNTCDNSRSLSASANGPEETDVQRPSARPNEHRRGSIATVDPRVTIIPPTRPLFLPATVPLCLRHRDSFVLRRCPTKEATTSAVAATDDVNGGSDVRTGDGFGAGDGVAIQAEAAAEREERIKTRRELLRAAFMAEHRAKQNHAPCTSSQSHSSSQSASHSSLSASSSSSEQQRNDFHDDEAVEVSEGEAQAEDDAVSSEEVDSSYEDDGELTYSSSECDKDDVADPDYDPNDDAPPSMEDDGYYYYINLVEVDADVSKTNKESSGCNGVVYSINVIRLLHVLYQCAIGGSTVLPVLS